VSTTLAALQSGALHFGWVVAIDGYGSLFSNESQSAVQAAWAPTDWATRPVIGGLIVELDNKQQLDPWHPFRGGGQCIIKVQCGSSTATDTFGIDLARSDAGAETFLEETATRTSTLFVGFADGFPLTGEACCGTETFEYGFVSGRRFGPTPGLQIGSNRGKYVAFGVKDSVATYGAVRFSEHHRVATQNNGVRLAPIVSEQPRTWTGRRVSVWMHTKNPVTGALNTKAEALCVFVGEFSEPRDDDAKGAWTTVLFEHLLNKIPQTMLLRDQWTATVDYGMPFKTGQRFKFDDFNGTTTKTANDLVVVSSGASGTNQVDAGIYGTEEAASILNKWLAGESGAGRINGNYTFNSPEDDGNGTARTVVHFFVPGPTTTGCSFRIVWPSAGWANGLGYHSQYHNGIHTCGGGHINKSPFAVQPFTFSTYDANNTLQIPIEAQVGIFQPQNATLPAAARALFASENPSHGYGLFLLECDTPLMLLGALEGNMLRRVRVMTTGYGLDYKGTFETLFNATGKVGSGPPRLRQVFVHESKCSTMMKWLFYSTGTSAYNHPTYDVLPHGQGLGIPYDLLGDNFELTCDAMPGASDSFTLVLDKPRKLDDAISAELVVRNAHLVFREGGFRWTSWTSPASAIATAVLDQDNKAETIDAKSSSRSTAVLDRSWVRNYVKINYNRDIGKALGGGEDVFLATPFIIEDPTSIDDMGGVSSPVTLDLRNVYNDTDQVGKGVRGLGAGFALWVRLWSQPLWKARRSIAPTLFEGFGVADVAVMDDPDLRDPTTGARSVSQLPVLVVGHRYQIHIAPAPGSIRFSGECDVIRLGADRIFAYSPAAEIDETKNDGGYTAGYDGVRTFQFKPSEHSESVETVDVGRFAVNDVVDIIRIDPDDPASVTSWRFTLTNVDAANNRATVDVAPSSPAFDTAKRYRMVYAPFSAVQGSQHLGSYQAGSNKTITETSPPDVYGAYSFVRIVRPTSYDHTKLAELPANKSYGPNIGTSRDSGYDKELALLLENIHDHQTRRICPRYDSTISANASTDGWQILRVDGYFIGDLIYGNGMNRYLWVAPHWRSQSGSSPAQLRIWLSGYLPSGTGFTNPDAATPGYMIKAPAVANSWSNVSSDNLFRNSLVQGYPLGHFNGHQYAFLIVEGTGNVAFHGYHQLNEGGRFES